jgi:hypothetical protein
MGNEGNIIRCLLSRFFYDDMLEFTPVRELSMFAFYGYNQLIFTLNDLISQYDNEINT